MKIVSTKTVGAALLLSAFMLTAVAPALAQKKKKGSPATPPPAAAANGEKKDAGGIQPYDKVITAKAVSDDGLFKVHNIDGKYFYEIPDSLVDREMLMVTRIAKTADNIGYGGENLRNQVVRWQKKDKKVLLRVVSYSNIADENSPMSLSVRNSNFEPIIQTFDIKAIGKDSSLVIEVTALFTKDVPALGFDDNRRKQFKVSSLDDSRTFIEHVKSFPINIEARHVLTYKAGEAPSNSSVGSISLEMNNSMILLPKKAMMPRLADDRVGFFAQSQVDFGQDAQKAVTTSYIRRWRLEPKDVEAYKRGELVEPKKQIVYYIDPATPEKWRPYLKQGVEDWNAAFERAGFKNAITAKDAPTKEEDPDWSPEDARYSVIRYFASDIQNAYGPHVADPRSGEILESDIGWYHNVMNLLRNWFFIQTAAINPDARGVKFKDEVMGRLIRFVSSHEVGHTLGLPHNFGSSFAYPVDSLRSATFTKKSGTAPSIMDYARFNYIAQPEDKGVSLMPDVGEYDKYAVMWGYKYIPEAKTSQEEKAILNKWILEKANNPVYFYGRQTGNPQDPRSQSEDLGNDAMKASTYGVANLKRIIPNLIEWTKEEGKNYDDLQELYGQVLGQWNRYNGHVRANIGGVYDTPKSYEQAGNVFVPVPKDIQKKAMTYLQKETFATPTWMLDQNILKKIENAGSLDRIRSAQVGSLNNLLDPSRIARLLEAEAALGNSTYTALEMMSDLRNGIWSELAAGRTIDAYRRNLQRAHIERLEYLMKEEPAPVPANFRAFIGGTPIDVSQSDIRPMVRAELKTLRTQINGAIARTADPMSKYHLEDAVQRINQILDPK
ncbi:zinc-dependent metalloprotease [Chryseotalea sanaruensis]|uniref:Zinc-dependent metalloprotease n=1 Tax=Chryseotalea sanaruensis TaxID=2482724 RepID=A0A401U8N3_9BACT|nr:zinc-dependent metalloprotease [Chryseotalea sanaruensis]GCC51237.1 zinc-dependent metalloprotease [Chryseotalea sanaruensis]